MTKGASHPRHGRPSPRLTEVTLIDRGGLLVQAHWSEKGALVITGQDLGDLPWEAHEYEYGITVRADALHLVAADTHVKVTNDGCAQSLSDLRSRRTSAIRAGTLAHASAT